MSDGVQRKKIEALKKRLKQKYPDQVHTYKAVWNAELQRIEGLEDFERRVTEDIQVCLNEELSKELVPTNPLDESLNVIKSTVESLSSSFAGREDELNKIDDFIEGTTGRVMLVCGNSGCGKSSIMSKTTKLCEEKGYITLPFFAGADVNCSTAENMLKILTYNLSRILGVQLCFDPESEEADISAVAEQYNLLLNRAALKNKTVLIIDAINQLAATEYESKLKWLNLFALNPALRIIISTTTDYYQLKYVKALNTVVLDVDYFSDVDIVTVVKRYFAVNHKEINDVLLNEIVNKEGADGNPCRKPLYLMTLLQELNNIGAEDFKAIRAREKEKGESSVDAIVNYLAETARSSPADFSMQLFELFEKVKAKAGEYECEIYACAIAASRRGVNERFIERLFKSQGAEFRSASFSYFKKLLKNDLCQRENGAWDFSHALVKEYFLDYFKDKPLYSTLLIAAADCLDADDNFDAFKRTEFVRYLAFTDSLDRFVPYYAAMKDDNLVKSSLVIQTQELQSTPDICDKLLCPITENTYLIWKFFEDAINGGKYMPRSCETYAEKVLNCIYETDYTQKAESLQCVAGIYYGLGGVALNAGYTSLAKDYLLMSLKVSQKAGDDRLKYGIYSRLALCGFKSGNNIKRRKYMRLAEDELFRKIDGGSDVVITILQTRYDDCKLKIQAIIVKKRAVLENLQKMRTIISESALSDTERALWYSRTLYISSHLKARDDENAEKIEEFVSTLDNSFERAETLYNLGVYFSDRSLKKSKLLLESAKETVKDLLASDESIEYLKLYEKITEKLVPLYHMSEEDCGGLKDEQKNCLTRLNFIAPEYESIVKQLELGVDDKERKKELKTLRRTAARGQASAEYKATNLIMFWLIAAVAIVFVVIFPLWFSVFRSQARALNSFLGQGYFASPFKMFTNFYMLAAFESFLGLCIYLTAYGLLQIFRPKNDYKMRVTWIKRCAVLIILFAVLYLVFYLLFTYFYNAEIIEYGFAGHEVPYMAILFAGFLLAVIMFNEVFNFAVKEMIKRPKSDNFGRFVLKFKYNLISCLVSLAALGAVVLMYWVGARPLMANGKLSFSRSNLTATLPPKVFYILAGALGAVILFKAIYFIVLRFVIKVKYGKEIKN